MQEGIFLLKYIIVEDTIINHTLKYKGYGIQWFES